MAFRLISFFRMPMPSGFRLLLAIAGLLLPLFESSALADPGPWPVKNTVDFLPGPIRFDLLFTGADGTSRSAILPSLPDTALNGMPDSLLKLKSLPLWNWTAQQGGYFDSVWRGLRASACADFRAHIAQRVNNSPNTAYDIQDCTLTERGFFTAAFEHDYTRGGDIKPTTALILNYQVPLNGVTFWVTSPHTCNRHSSNCGAQPVDPQFTAQFEVDITEVCIPGPNAPGPGFSLPVQCSSMSGVTNVYVDGGDVTGKLQAVSQQYATQMASFAASLLASGGSSTPGAVAAAIGATVNELANGIATAISDQDTAHLRDMVSAWLGQGTAMPASAAKFADMDKQINSLFQQAYFATLNGFTGFLAGAGPSGGLEFALTYPAPKKPVLQNATAASNGGSLFAPTISLSQSQAQPGDIIPIHAQYFRSSFVDSLSLSWNKVVIGSPKSTLSGGPAGKLVVTGTAATIQNLKPGTAYNFAVEECDGITCAPPSDELHTATQAGGSNHVIFWMDGDKAHPIGDALIASNGGTFTANLAIPANIPPGQHLISAAAPDQPGTATTPISICQTGGCGASLALVNMSNGTLYPSGAQVMAGLPARLHGARFDAGSNITIYLDTDTGPKAGTAHADAAGLFDATVKTPSALPGQHQFLAVEAGGSKRAVFKIYLQAAAQ